MDLTTATEWIADRRNGVLITLRRDGRAQSSDIVYAVEGSGDHAVVRISITADRAKARNLQRDPRAVLHVTDPASWSYVSLDGTTELSPVAATPDDATVDELVALFEAVSGAPHDDWNAYRAAMVADRRLVVRFRPASATGQTH